MRKHNGEPLVLIFHDTNPVIAGELARLLRVLAANGYLLVNFNEGRLQEQITKPLNP